MRSLCVSLALFGLLTTFAKTASIHQDGAQVSLHATGAKFSVREQGEDICEAGTKQWTGTIDVGDGKSIFFCTHSSPPRSADRLQAPTPIPCA